MNPLPAACKQLLIKGWTSTNNTYAVGYHHNPEITGSIDSTHIFNNSLFEAKKRIHAAYVLQNEKNSK